MLAAALVVFREVLEAALIVSVVLAATHGVKRRLLFVGGGVAAGILGSFLVALFTSQLASSFAGNGQDLFSACVMFAVVGLLGWHVIWMQRHGRELVAEMKEVGAAVKSGTRPLWALGAVTALAVLREGAEIVLFMQGLIASSPFMQVGAGFMIGLGAGMAVGAILYWGFLRLPVARLFTATNFLLMLIAAGMAARGAGKLIQAGYLPSLRDPLWDTSNILSEQSMGGQFLSALVGYMAEPSGMQMIFYGTTLVAICALATLVRVKPAAATTP